MSSIATSDDDASIGSTHEKSRASRVSMKSEEGAEYNDWENKKEFSWRLDPEESLSDWTIVIQQEENQCNTTSYHVHKCMLAVGPRQSQYFAALIRGKQFAETKSNTSEIDLPHLAASAFPIYLDFAYSQSGELNVKTGNAVPLRYLAQYFGIWFMNKKVLQFIQDDMKVRIEPGVKYRRNHPWHPQQPDEHPEQPDNHPQQPDNHPQQPDEHPQQPNNHPQQADNHPRQPLDDPGQRLEATLQRFSDRLTECITSLFWGLDMKNVLVLDDRLAIYYSHATFFNDEKVLSMIADTVAVTIVFFLNHSRFLQGVHPRFLLKVISHVAVENHDDRTSQCLSMFLVKYYECHKDEIDMTIFLKLTDESVIPRVAYEAAFSLLSYEAAMLADSNPAADTPRAGLTSLQKRCVEVLAKNWNELATSDECQSLPENVSNALLLRVLAVAKEEIDRTNARLNECLEHQRSS